MLQRCSIPYLYKESGAIMLIQYLCGPRLMLLSQFLTGLCPLIVPLGLVLLAGFEQRIKNLRNNENYCIYRTM